MEIKVKITQVREGYATIPCDNVADGLKRADELYNVQGRELPDMEDVGALKLSLAGVIHQSREEVMKAGPLKADEVELYLMSHGCPHPGEADMGWLLYAGERQLQATEAVRNQYDLSDVDRWFHLMDMVGNELSFRAAMFIDNALSEKDSDAMEVQSIQEILEASDGELTERLEQLSSCMKENGKCPENSWNVTAQDIAFLSKAFDPGNILPEAIVFRKSGDIKDALFDCTYVEGLVYCQSHNWVLKDENGLAWDLVLEDQRERFRPQPELTTKEDLFKALESASVIEYKGIRFDDWHVDKEYDNVWAEICQDHADKFKDLISGELSDDDAIGTCSVEGCDVNGMESGKGHYYIDFDWEHIKIVESRTLNPTLKALEETPSNKKPSLLSQIKSAENRAGALISDAGAKSLDLENGI